MSLTVKASDLYYRYPKDTVNRHRPKFSGKPDSHPFNRDDLYEVLPMYAAVMNALGSSQQHVLYQVEELLILNMPRFIETREQVFDFLVGCMAEQLGRR
ncbi:MAG: hypothetical protein FIA91_07720 [Geobacter sp.]|nr:hypothetical protein [Geobacter sp.]